MKHFLFFNLKKSFFGFSFTFFILISVLMPLTVQSQCANSNDYKALRAIYLATDGDKWKTRTNWPNAMIFEAFPDVYQRLDMSTWHGITCKNGRVTRIDLSQNNVRGFLPKEIEMLDELVGLNLNENDFDSIDFTVLSPLKNLLELRFSKNELQGDFSALGDLTSLQFLDLSDNLFIDTLPDAVFALSVLRELYIQNNNFSGVLSEKIGQLTELRILDGRNNMFSGQLPQSLSQLNFLSSIDLSYNNLSGSIPSTLLDVPSVWNIQLSNNRLSGCIPQNANLYCVPTRTLNVSCNNLLPWQGDLAQFCLTNGSVNAQIGAPCYNFNPSDGDIDVIMDDCMCGYSIPMFLGSSVSGHVFIDLDGNGAYGGIDIPFEGVEIVLYPHCDVTAIPYRTMSNIDGFYTFTDLPLPCHINEWLIEISPNSDIQCDGAQSICVELSSNEGGTFEYNFACSPPDCTSNPFSVDNICQQAFDNPLCDLRVIQQWPCGQNPIENGPWLNQEHCQGVFNNTSFYGFVAGSGDYTINFTVFNCAGTGVQYGVYDACEPNAGPICNGNANTGTVTIPSDQLVPCKTYVFWINGFGGSVCSYYTFVEGDWNYCSVPDVADIEFDSGCPGALEPYCPSSIPRMLTLIPDVSTMVVPIEDINDARYIWSIRYPSGRVDNIFSFGPEGIKVKAVFNESGTYEICVIAGHPCSGDKAPFCIKIELAPVPDVDTVFVACRNDFPWDGAVDNDGNEILDPYGNPWYWEGGPISYDIASLIPPPSFFSFQSDSCGCPYKQFFKFNIIEEPDPINVVCVSANTSEVIFEWNEIQDAIDYEVEIMTPNQVGEKIGRTQFRVYDMQNGELATIRVRARLEESCQTTDFSEGSCVANSCPIPIISIDIPKEICKSNDNNSIALSDTTAIIFGGFDVSGYFTLEGPGVLGGQTITEIDINSLNVGDYTLRYLYNFIVSEDTCRGIASKPFKIVSKPMASFAMDSIGCIQDTFWIAYDRQGIITDLSWDLGGDHELGFVSQNLFYVVWKDAGEKTVQLTTINNSCLSDPYIQEVTVEAVPMISDIICQNATTDSLHIVWGSSPCAKSYEISVNGTVQPMLVDTFITLYNLSLGQEIDITVHPQSECLCDFDILTKTCVVMPSSTFNSYTNKWKLYPNPSKDFINIVGPLPSHAQIFSIIDVMGRYVSVGLLSESIDISQLSDGMYILRFDYQNEKVNMKFVKH